MLPDTDLRYFPRRLVPFALEAGWCLHPESDRTDWAVLMTHSEGGREIEERPVRKLVMYAGAE